MLEFNATRPDVVERIRQRLTNDEEYAVCMLLGIPVEYVYTPAPGGWRVTWKPTRPVRFLRNSEGCIVEVQC